MAFYDIQERRTLSDAQTVLDNNDNTLSINNILKLILDTNIHDMGHIDYPKSKYSPTVSLACTEVFRASDMSTVETCVNGIQHSSPSSLSPPITPQTYHKHSAGLDSDCASCVKCQETAGQKRARRREQNRQSQRKFRARKEVKLSDARSRIRDLEALIRAQEKTNIELKLAIEGLSSGESRLDTSGRRDALALAEKQTSTSFSQMTNSWKGAARGDKQLSDSPSVVGYDHGPSHTQESGKKK